MRSSKSFTKVVFCLFTVALLIPQSALSQTEKLGIVSYTAPKGWTKTTKENIISFSKLDQTTGAFCIITLYGATPGTGSPERDFKREWNNLLVEPFKAEGNPETETESDNGWTAIAEYAASCSYRRDLQVRASADVDPKRSAERAFALAASTSRSRGGEFVTSDASSSCAACAT